MTTAVVKKNMNQNSSSYKRGFWFILKTTLILKQLIKFNLDFKVEIRHVLVLRSMTCLIWKHNRSFAICLLLTHFDVLCDRTDTKQNGFYLLIIFEVKILICFKSFINY